MNEHNIYELLNETEMDFSKYEEEPVDELQQQRAIKSFKKTIKKEERKNKKGWVALTLVAAGILFMLTPYGDQVGAQVKSKLDDFTYTLSQSMGNIPGETYRIGQTSAFGNYNVKIEDILLDEETLTTSILVESSEALSNIDTFNFLSMTLTVNGVNYGVTGAAGSGHLLDNGLYQQTMTYTFDEPLNLQENNEVYLHVSGLSKNYEEIISDDRTVFDMSGSYNELAGNMQTLEVSKEFSTESGSGVIDSLKLHPLHTKVNYRMPQADTENAFVEVEMILPDGRRGMFAGSSSSEASTTRSGMQDVQQFYSFDMTDDFTYEEIMTQDYIQLQFYKVPLPEESGRVDTSNKIPIGSPVRVDLEG